MREYIIASVGFFTTIVGTLLAHLITKRKYSAEVDRILIENIEKLIENIEKAFNLYKKLTEETESKVNIIINKYNLIEQENISLKEEMKVFNEKINKLIETSCTTKECNKRKKIEKQ